MKKRQISGYEAGKRVQGLWLTHKTELDTITEMAEEKVLLDKTLESIENAATIQSTDNSGLKTLKDEKRDTAVETVIKFALRGRVKAKQSGSTSLQKELAHEKTYYIQTEAETTLARLKATKDKIKSKLTILTNITPEDITEMEEAIQKYEDLINVPKANKQTQKVTGTDQIPVLIHGLSETVDSIGNLIHSYFPNTVLSREFDALSKLGSPISRHNHLILTIKDAETNKPIANAVATKDSINQSITANEQGVIEFPKVMAGKQHFTITAPTYNTQTVTIKIIRSTTNQATIQLKKK
jgi:hypothetical protein